VQAPPHPHGSLGRVFVGAERRPQKGKLIEAARRWAGGGPAKRRSANVGAGDDGGDVEVIPLHRPLWPHLELFMACERSWRYPPMGGPPIGLDWSQVRPLAEGLGVAWNRETIDRLQAMEHEAATIWTAEWKRKNPTKPT
jgi:hypothetical protein